MAGLPIRALQHLTEIMSCTLVLQKISPRTICKNPRGLWFLQCSGKCGLKYFQVKGSDGSDVFYDVLGEMRHNTACLPITQHVRGREEDERIRSSASLLTTWQDSGQLWPHGTVFHKHQKRDRGGELEGRESETD